MAGLLAALVAAAALAYLAAGDLAQRRLVGARTAELRDAEAANALLAKRAARLRDALHDAVGWNARAGERIAALAMEVAAARRRLDAAEARLRAARDRQLAPPLAEAIDRAAQREDAADAARAELARKVHQAEAELVAARARNGALHAALDGLLARLRSAAAAREDAVKEREAASARWRRLQSGAAAAAGGMWTRVAQVLAGAGVNVDRFFARFGLSPRAAEGGPFEPPRPGLLQSPARAEAFGKLLTALPLRSPLAHYRLGSTFGNRRDPFNAREAFHPGIDLDAPYMSPVYATAPGTVVYAGWRDGYGKIVEIDHGGGIHTRYGHLHRYIVVVGEKVAAGTQIGYLGSTGRSTGPHVHYEIDINGEPRNPERFLALGRDVTAVARHR